MDARKINSSSDIGSYIVRNRLSGAAGTRSSAERGPHRAAISIRSYRICSGIARRRSALMFGAIANVDRHFRHDCGQQRIVVLQ